MNSNLIKNCSKEHLYPWMHYEVDNYFDYSLLENLYNLIPTLKFEKCADINRLEFNINDKNLNNIILNKVADNFLNKDNLKFLSNLDDRIKSSQLLLRASIWKDYPGFNLPIHTDSAYKLFTMQIYLPPTEGLGFGTSIFDKEQKLYKVINYKKNCGYFFFPNINNIKTWHSFEQDITSERCSVIFNIMDRKKLVMKNLSKGILTDISNYIELSL